MRPRPVFSLIAAAALAALCLLAAGCAGSAPVPAPEEPGKVTSDRGIARMLASGNIEIAFRTADSLSSLRDVNEQEVGDYWRSVCYLYQDQPDSALAILEERRGKWRGGLRNVHSEAFLRLAREASLARVAARVRREEAQRASQERALLVKVEALQKETGDLKVEIARLETEKKKYEKLLKDLETIH